MAKKIVIIVTLLVVASAVGYWFFAGEIPPQTNEPVQDSLQYYDKSFIEVVYEQSYEPFADAPITPREPPARLKGYFFYDKEQKLFSCMGKRSRQKESFYLGVRMHFKLGKQIPSIQVLYEIPDTSWEWQVDKHPDPLKIRLNPLCWIRVPVKFSLDVHKDGYLVKNNDEQANLLTPGNSVVWQGQRTIKFSDYIDEISGYSQQNLLTPEQRETARTVLHVNENDELTLYGRITAICHGVVKVCEHDPKWTYQYAAVLYKKKKYKQALSIMREYFKMVREDMNALVLLQELEKKVGEAGEKN